MNKLFNKILLSAALSLLLGLFASSGLQAQGKAPIVQFSGIILTAEDSSNVVPGAHIYVPKAGRGTSTNVLGYFSLPVLVGDSVVISAVGYEKQHFIIPNDKGDQLTVIIELSQDTTFLPEIAIFPYPTEEMFKEAILALEFPDQENRDFMKKNLSPDVMAYLMEITPMDGSENYKMYMQQQFMQQHSRYGVRPNPFFNPLNWAQFIQSIRRGDLKN